MTHDKLLAAKCFCGNPATNRNTVKDKRGLDYSMVYIYPTCNEHWNSTPPELWGENVREAYKSAIARWQK